jgi:hypothetical protein
LRTDNNCLNYYVFYDHKIIVEDCKKKVLNWPQRNYTGYW